MSLRCWLSEVVWCKNKLFQIIIKDLDTYSLWKILCTRRLDEKLIKFNVKSFQSPFHHRSNTSSSIGNTKMRGSKVPANMHNTICCPICIPIYFLSSKGHNSHKNEGSKMQNYIWGPIYIPSFMISGSVVSEELQWQGHL